MALLAIMTWLAAVYMLVVLVDEKRKEKRDWQDDMARALEEWNKSPVKARMDRAQAIFDLSEYIGRKTGHITRANMNLIGGRWYVHTCCDGWVEVSALLQGEVKRANWYS